MRRRRRYRVRQMVIRMQKNKVPKLGSLYIVVVINLTTTKRSSKEQSHQNDDSADSAKTNENLAKEASMQNAYLAKPPKSSMQNAYLKDKPKTCCFVSIENINNSTIVICSYFCLEYLHRPLMFAFCSFLNIKKTYLSHLQRDTFY